MAETKVIESATTFCTWLGCWGSSYSAAEWAAWTQAAGSVIAILVAIAVPGWAGRARHHRTVRGYFETIAMDVKMARHQADVYVKDVFRTPAYRLPLHGHRQALPGLLMHGEISLHEASVISQWYIDAESFNRSLDFAQALQDADPLDKDGRVEAEGERSKMKALQIVPGGRTTERYTAAIDVLRTHMTWLPSGQFDELQLYPATVDNAPAKAR